MAIELKYFEGEKTFQKQKGFFIANNLGGPLDITSWVLYKDNLSKLDNKYIGKKVYVLTEDEIYYYTGSQWKQLHNLYKANTQNYKKDGKNISSQYLVKFYNIGVKTDVVDGSENNYIVAKKVSDTGVTEWVSGMTVEPGMIVKMGNYYSYCIRRTTSAPFSSNSLLSSNPNGVNAQSLFTYFNSRDYECLTCMLSASLVVPTKYSNSETFLLEYPTELKGVMNYPLYYKWYRNSFDNSVLKEGYDNTFIPNYSLDELRKSFSDKFLCEVYIEKTDGTKILVAKNSCHVVSEPYADNNKNKGLIYMSDKVTQHPRGFINTNKLAAGVDSAYGVENMSEVAQHPLYYGKRVYVHSDDSFYTYKHSSKTFIPEDGLSSEDKIRYINNGISSNGHWVKETGNVTNVVRYDNNATLSFVIDRSDITDVSINKDSNVSGDVPFWGYRKMSYSAHLNMFCHNNDASIAIEKLTGNNKNKCSFNPTTAEMFGIDAKVQWTVSVLTDNRENYHDLIPGDNPTREESKALILPTAEEHITDYYGNPIVSNPNSFDFEFGVTNDVYDAEKFNVKCEITFNTEGKVAKTLTKSFDFVLERKSYIDFTTMKMTQVTPLGGKFQVYGQRYDFKNESSIISDASKFFALDNTIGLRYKVFYTASDVTKAANNWIELDSNYINFYQDDAHNFRFTRKVGKGALPSSLNEMIGGVGNDNGKLPFGYYRIVPFIQDVMFNLKFNASEGIKDYAMFQNITKFSLRTTEFGEDDWNTADEITTTDRGNWKSGMHINYGEIVRQNGEVFRCINKNGSDYSPLKIFRTNANELTQFSDSGYILEGTVNEDYTFDKASIKVGYFDTNKVTLKIKDGIQEWFDAVYPNPVHRGEWYNGIRVHQNDIVTFDGSTFQCIDVNGTTYCPKIRYMTNTERVLRYNDEGYVLTGEWDSLHYTMDITVTPGELRPVDVEQGTIVKHDGNYYIALRKNNECPVDSEGKLNSSNWKVCRTEQYVVIDKSSSTATPKNLVIYGNICGQYIDLKKFSYHSDTGNTLTFNVIDASSSKMTEDGDYYSVVNYELKFADKPSKTVEKEIVEILYATATNPLSSQKLLVNEGFVYHPYTEPDSLDLDSVYKRVDGSEVFLAETNGYKFRYNDENNFKVKYKDENVVVRELDKYVEYYVDGVRINRYSTAENPLLHLGSSVEARMNFDTTGIVGEDVPNYVGIKMPYPIYDISFDCQLEDGLNYLTYPYVDYEVDFLVKETTDGVNFNKIDDDEYDVRVWTVDNDVFVNGVNIRNNPVNTTKEAFKIQIHSTEILEIDLHAEMNLYGGCKKTIVKNFPIQTAVPEHQGEWKLYEIMTSLEIGVDEENRSIGERYQITDVLKSIKIAFKDGSRQTYEGVMIQRMIDSGRISFNGTNYGCDIRNNTIVASAFYPKIEIVFKGWETSAVDTTTYLNFYPEIDFIGFRDTFVSNISPVDFGVLENMSRSNNSGKLTLDIYARGRNLSGLRNSIDSTSVLSMELGSYLDNNGFNTSIYRTWDDEVVEGASFTGTGFTSNEEMSAIICSFPYKNLQDRVGDKIDKYDVGFGLEVSDVRLYGFIKMRPIINLKYRKSDGELASVLIETETDAMMGKLTAKITYNIQVEGANATVTGAGTYILDSSVVLTATPNEGYTFRRWMKNELTMDSVCDTSTFEFICSDNAKYIARVLGENVQEHQVTLTNATPSKGKISGEGIYLSTDTFQIVASPNTGFYFAGWFSSDGTLVSEESVITFSNISSDINYTAKFDRPVALKCLVTPENYGTVTIEGDKTTYKKGETFKVTANAIDGVSKFIKWTDKNNEVVSTENPFESVIEANTLLYANFADEYIIRTTCDSASGTTEPSVQRVNGGDEVTITATPKNAHVFNHWNDSEGNNVSTSNVYTFVPTKSDTYTAKFDNQISVQISKTGNGSVSGSGLYNPGSAVVLTASPDSGNYFVGWYVNGTVVSSEQTLTLDNVTTDLNFTAKFEKYTSVSVRVNNTNLGSVTGDGSYKQGESVTITATGSANTSQFLGWYTSDDTLVTSDKNYTFVVSNTDVLYIAKFVLGYIVSASVSPEDYGTISGLESYYSPNSTAHLCVNDNPDKQSEFVGWYEGTTLKSSARDLYLCVDSNKTVVAKYAKRFKIQTTSNNIVYGSTNYANPAYFKEGTSVRVYAYPYSGYEFVKWTDEDGNTVSQLQQYDFTINDDTNLIAVFKVTEKFTVTVDVEGEDYGFVSGTKMYNSGETVELVAYTRSSGKFDGWYNSGGELLSTDKEYSFVITSDVSLKAKFSKKVTYTLILTSEGHGTVSGAGEYEENEVVTVYAVPTDEYTFGGWYDASGELISDDNIHTMTINCDYSLKAVFIAPIYYSITTIADGRGTVSGAGRYKEGAFVYLTVDYDGSRINFDGWYENGVKVCTLSYYSFTATKDRILTAKFTPIVTINVSTNDATLGSVSGATTANVGDEVAITATKKNPDAKFFGWYKNNEKVSDDLKYTFTVGPETTQSYLAEFGIINVTGEGQGVVKPSEGVVSRYLYGEGRHSVEKTDTVTFYVPSEGSKMRIDIEVSSEPHFDIFIFDDCDGNEFEYSGEESDTKIYNLSEGPKIMTFVYSKDGSMTSGHDFGKYEINIDCYKN